MFFKEKFLVKEAVNLNYFESQNHEDFIEYILYEWILYFKKDTEKIKDTVIFDKAQLMVSRYIILKSRLGGIKDDTKSLLAIFHLFI